MDKQEHIQYLREKYIQLNEEYLKELRAGKSIVLLKSLNEIICTLASEIIETEIQLQKEKGQPGS